MIEQEKSNVVKYRKDYKIPEFTVLTVQLEFELDEERSKVINTMIVAKQRSDAEDLYFDGEDIELESVELAGRMLKEGEDFFKGPDGNGLTIRKEKLPTNRLKKPFEVRIINWNHPIKNTELSGLYKSGDLLATQCEAEGFRRITYFIDRPDNMSCYQVRITADRSRYPVILCNGDCVREERDLPGNKQALTFIDPFKKPSYLFALVAGKLDCIRDAFVTREGAEVDIEVYAESKYIDRCQWAKEVTLKAMAWDEEKYGRVYDLSTFRVVCIEDFNAGAMENKSLVTFNVSAIVASKDTVSDSRFNYITGTVGHEYFHNWSGNRVTVRDWFQVTLKEGFTSLRHSEFVGDQFSNVLERIQNVQEIRSSQFPEDASPMAHPIRPESYQSIDNFYTMTVYRKGREVLRALRVLVGDENWRKGCDLYFSRYDGQAVSCDELRNSIAEASGRNLAQYERWYCQKGTPKITILERAWHSDTATYRLRLRQTIPPQDESCTNVGPAHIPILFGLIGKGSRKDLLPSNYLLELTEYEQTFEIPNIEEDAVPSILRDFSAPVNVESHLSFDELALLMAYDTDPFKVWDCGQEIFKHFIINRAKAIVAKTFNPDEFDATKDPLAQEVKSGISEALKNKANDYGFVAAAIQPPASTELWADMTPSAEPKALRDAVKTYRRQIAHTFRNEMTSLLNTLQAESQAQPWEVSAKACGRRSLEGALRSYLYHEKNPQSPNEIHRGFYSADNFNDRMLNFSLALRLPADNAERQKIVADMYDICKADNSMLDSWFSAQASSVKSVEELNNLLRHPDFEGNPNPNRFRALVRTLGTANVDAFHADDGKGYEAFARQICSYDKINRYNAAITCKCLLNYTKFSPERQALMKKQLQWLNEQNLSTATAEVVARGLDTKT